MKNFQFFVLLLLLIVYQFRALGNDSDSIRHIRSDVNRISSMEAPRNVPVAISGFTFEELDKEIETNLMPSAYAAALTPPPASDPSFESKLLVKLGKAKLSNKVKKAQELVDDAIVAGKYIDKLTGGDIATMPLVKKQKFGTSDIYIIFHSARIYPDYAEIEVYIKIDLKRKNFDGTDAILYFGARDIKFSKEKGLISGSVGLLADYCIKLAEDNGKVTSALWLRAMEKGAQTGGQNTSSKADDTYAYKGTYVNFDCDGFKEMGVGGQVFFSREWLIPVDEFGHPRPVAQKDQDATARVNGWFQVTVQDWNDMYFHVQELDHFTLAKWPKMSLHLRNTVVDLSSHRTPEMPYTFSTHKDWEGIYIEYVSITLPQPFKSKCNSFGSTQETTCRMKVSADHLVVGTVDQNEPGYGLYGDFRILGQAPLIGGPIMAGQWGYSMDEIEIGFAANELDKFRFAGYLGVPLLSKDGPLKYDAGWEEYLTPEGNKFDEYHFNISDQLTNPKQFPMWNVVTLNISNWEVDIRLRDNDFGGHVAFWGNLEIGNKNDYASNQTGSVVKIPKLTFHNLRISTFSPKLHVDLLELTDAGSIISGFPVKINKIAFTSSDDICNIQFDIGINLMKGSSNIDASGFFTIVGEYKRDINDRNFWVYKDFVFNGASVKIDLPQFYGVGTLQRYTDDPIYGNGFHASIHVKIIGLDLAKPSNKGMFELKMTAIFGSNDGYRYWLVDGFVGSDKLKIPVFPPYYLNGFGGGAFHHMKPAAYSGSSDDKPSIGEDLSGIIYKPNQETKLGIKFSTSFAAEGGFSSGLLTCIIRFGNKFSLQNITFWGTADFMISSSKSEIVTQEINEDALNKVVKSKEELDETNKQQLAAIPNNTVRANLGMSFSFEEKFIFHGFGEVLFNVNNNITGHGTVDFLIDRNTDRWHVWVGGYDNGSTKTLGFFDENEELTLYPVTIKIKYDDIFVTAKSYFLTGNDIPGPPPIPREAATFFADKNPKDNRSLLKCENNNPALGTGIAFGSSAYFKFKKVKVGRLSRCFIGNRIDIGAGIGFDISLLKYDQSAFCASGLPIGGINGLRATGRVFAFIDIEKGHMLCIPLPRLGIGAMLDFDVPDPLYFKGIIRVNFAGLSGDVSAEWGDQCGVPCNP